ncbi:MAG: threonine ammonia-lyase [Pseudomonadales bacterium]
MSDIEAAHKRLGQHLRETPCNRSATFSAKLGCGVFLKFENLQFTSSFKERGALNYLMENEARLGSGIIAMSAGNHAQALAYHGQRMGIPTTIVMPRHTPNAKVEATRVFQAEVILEGTDFDETRQFTRGLARERGLTLIHPFDDPSVIAGQGTVGLEMMAQVPELDVVIVPVGGGGLIGGTALACKTLKPEIEVIGVQMERYPGAYRMVHDRKVDVGVGGTVAEGIAVKTPGEMNLKLIDQYVDDICLVSEAAVEQAIFDLLEIEKTVVEGAGAAPMALLAGQRQRFANRNVGLIVSGGNIDMMILSSVLTRSLARSNRLVRLRVEIPDTPGALAALTGIVGRLDSNIMDIEHQRAFAGSSVRATVVELVLQMRGEEQQETVTAALKEAGYVIL